MRAAANLYPTRLPGAEELRMVRAIARFALLEAARHREYRASFRGFRVRAQRRRSAPGSDVLVEVSVCVSFAGHLVERALVTMVRRDDIEPIL